MVWLELRQAVRQLSKRPGYALLSVLVLAGGLGSTLFVLSAVDAFVLKPLPFPEPERLVQVGTHAEDDLDFQSIAASDFAKIDDSTQPFGGFAAFGTGTINLADAGGPQRYDGAFITHDLLPLLDVRPALGRGFTTEDDRPGAPTIALIADRVWRDRYGADPAIVGREIRINAAPATIVGVLPPRFAFPFRETVWIPLRADPTQPRDESLWVDVMGRLAPGIGSEAAEGRLRAAFGEAIKDEPDFYRGQTLAVRPLKDHFVSPQTKTYIGLMFATALCVLLIACANVANLMLSQMAARHRELSLRAALGAARLRLMTHVFTECLLLALAATAVGLAIARYAGDLVMETFVKAGDSAAWFIQLQLDARLMVYALGIALLTTLVAGLAPALRATGAAMQAGLREGDKSGGTGGGFARFSRGLVVAEVAISCVLLIGAGASVRSLRAMLTYDIGVETPPAQILTGRIGLFPQAFPTGAEQVALFQRVVERLTAEPGVRAATAASILPGFLAGGGQIAAYGEDYPNDAWPEMYSGAVDDGFATTYGVRLLSGRFFGAQDTADAEKVAVIDERMAATLFPGRDPLGQRLKLNPRDDASPWRTVVGVIGNMHLENLEDEKRPTALVPLRQDPVRFASIAVHLESDAMAFAPRLAQVVREVDADTPVYWVRTHERALEIGRIGPTVLANIFGVFGVIGLILAGAGLYGVLSFAVTQRTREIGLRRAVGAESGHIVQVVTSRSAWQVGLGLLIGLLLGVPWAMLLAREELGVAAIDPVLFGSVLGTISLAALASSLIPVRRALRVEPMEALRYE